MTRAVGIDLGTTHSAASYIDDTGKTAMIVNSEGDILLPSVVMFDDNGVVVGKSAKRATVLGADRVAVAAKRDMGNAVYSRPIRGKYLAPEIIQACVLRRLRSDITRSIGPDFQVVLTTPAFFDESRRKATADAGKMAGLKVLDIVNEPTAAALAFGESHGFLTSGTGLKGEVVMVYDLGGGTFDATLIDIEPGHLRTIATDGDVHLGGRDWDLRLADYVCEQFAKKHHGQDPRGNPLSLEKVLLAIEEAKQTLSVRNKTTALVDFSGSTAEIEVTRELFENLTADLLDRTQSTLKQLLQQANLQWSDVKRFLLVGGSTRMPMVPRMLKNVSGMQPDQSVHPDEAVARGAALHAAYLMAQSDPRAKQPTYSVTNVNSHSLGIEGIDIETTRKRNWIVLPKNTPLPAQVTSTFSTKVQNQKSVVIQVLEGETTVPSECTPIGRTVIRGLPQNLPQGSPVDVTFQYTPSGRLTVKAKVSGTASEANLNVERLIGLDDAKVNRWSRVLSDAGKWGDFEQTVEAELGLSRPAAKDDFEEATAELLSMPPTSVRSPQSSPGPMPLPGAALPGPSPHNQPGARPGPTPVYPGGGSPHMPNQPMPLGPTMPAQAMRPMPAPAPVGQAPMNRGAMPAAPLAAAPAAMSRPMPARPMPAQPAAAPARGLPDPSPQNESSGISSALVNIMGFVFFTLIGVTAGYYAVCWWMGSNLLSLPLPGLPGT